MKKASQAYNVHAAKTHLSKLLQKVADGEEVIIAKAGKPFAKIVPLDTPPAKREWKPDPRWKAFAEIDWFARDPEIERLFYGEDE